MPGNVPRGLPWVARRLGSPVISRTCVAAAFVLGLGVTGCGEDGGGSAPAADAGLTYSATRVAASDPAIDLSAVGPMAVGSDGTLYVADAQNRVVALNAAGELLRVIGRGGEGPGEFSFINDVRVLPGDSLLVLDPMQDRISVFRPNSAVLAHTRPLRQEVGEFVVQASPGADGSLLTYAMRAHGPESDAANRNDVLRSLARDETSRPVLALSPNEVLQINSSGAMGFFSPGFAPRRIVRLAAGRAYTAWTDSAAVKVFDAGGRQLATITPRALPSRQPITAREYDSVAATFGDAAFAKRARPQVQARWRTWPLIDDLLVDDGGGVWIKPAQRQGENRWLHHDAAGAFVGSLELPANVRPRLISRDRVYCVVKDDLDVPQVVVYTLHRAPAGTAAG